MATSEKMAPMSEVITEAVVDDEITWYAFEVDFKE